MTSDPGSSNIHKDEGRGAVLKTRRWYKNRDFKFTALVVLFVILFQSYGYLTGPSRIGENLQQAMDSGKTKLEILVWAKFPAEAFHMELYQTLGAIRGEQEGAVRLAGVRPSDVRFLSRKYWIQTIAMAPPED